MKALIRSPEATVVKQIEHMPDGVVGQDYSYREVFRQGIKLEPLRIIPETTRVL
ncbi:MAG: hypothetical protein ABW185_03460 [Sedimenticola sp.]